jgi:hypothetical protein
VIYLVKEAYEEVMGPWPDPLKARRMGGLRADLDRFLEEAWIIVGRRRSRHAYMKRLDPGRDEVWEIRSRDPQPEMRVFGRFAECDVFVGTRCVDRDYLGKENSREWRDEIIRCATDWRNLFFPYQPLTDRPLNDYISSNVIDHRDLVR